MAKALSKEPEDRFDSATAFAHALRSPEPIAVAKRVASAGRKPKLLAAALVCLLVVLTGVSMLSPSPADAVQQSLQSGQVDQAAVLLSTMIAEDGESAQTHLFNGHIAFARDHDSAAVDSYLKALKLNPEAGGDDYLGANVPVLLKRSRRSTAKLLKTLARAPHEDSAPLLAVLAQQAPNAHLRRIAYEGIERLEQAELLDTLNYLGAELKKVGGKRCPVRKWYVDRLIATEDPQIVPLLKRELGRKDGGRVANERGIGVVRWAYHLNQLASRARGCRVRDDALYGRVGGGEHEGLTPRRAVPRGEDPGAIDVGPPSQGGLDCYLTV